MKTIRSSRARVVALIGGVLLLASLTVAGILVSFELGSVGLPGGGGVVSGGPFAAVVTTGLPAVQASGGDFQLNTGFLGANPDLILGAAGANQPPDADANGPYFVECTGGEATVALYATASSDPEGEDLLFLWSTDCPGASFDDPQSATPILTFSTASAPLQCEVTVAVTDGVHIAFASALVIVRDTTPPTIDVVLTPDVLWPPDGKLVRITPSVTVHDDCDPGPDVELVSITSSEPAAEGDIVIDADGRIFLRATRDASGGGRLYTVTYRAADESGNTGLASANVLVPRSQGFTRRE